MAANNNLGVPVRKAHIALYLNFFRGRCILDENLVAGIFRSEEYAVLPGLFHTGKANLEFLVLLRAYIEFYLALCKEDALAVTLYPPFELCAVYGGEVITVEDLEHAVFKVFGAYAKVLVDVLHLIECGMRITVRVHYAVAAEVLVGRRILSVVSAVGPATFFVVQALVHPVPDKTALEVGVAVELLPHEVHGAVGVTHGVGVLAKDNGAVTEVFSHLLEPLGVRIHGVDEVRIILEHCPLIYHGPVLAILFQGFQELVGLIEVYAVTGLVAKGEDGYAGVVGRAPVHVEGTVNMLCEPFRLVAKGLVQGITHTVAFNVAFVVYVEAKGIAELIELTRLGIVAGADGVDVGLPHEEKVLEDVLLGCIMTGVGVMLMEVHALELDGLAVHEECVDKAAVSVRDLLHLKAAESHVEAGVFPVHPEKEGVQLRSFGAPAANGRDSVGYRCH